MFLNFSSSCTKVTMSYWVGWLRSVGHAEEKKKRKIQRPFGLRSRRKGDFGWSKVKVSGLHSLWLDVKSVKERKEGKDEELNREAIRPFGQKWRKEEKSQSVVRTRCSLEELREWEQAKEKRKIERVRENTQWRREQWVKKKNEFFYSSGIFKCCNLYSI